MAAGRTGRKALLLAAPLLLAGHSAAAETEASGTSSTSPQAADITVSFAGLRSARGILRVCLTRNPRFLTTCDKDPASVRGSVAAGPNPRLRLAAVPSGDWAMSVLHDENANGHIDMVVGIPREGVGFSENPRLRFGPPKFEAARFHVGTVAISKQIQLKYFL